MRKTAAGYLIIIAIIVLLAAACSGNNGEEETKAEPEQNNEDYDEENEGNNEPEDEPVEEEASYANAYPLTGKGTDEDVDHRAFGVMVENSSAARPQSGVYMADVVYEVLSEGRITRLLAFYHSQEPERIGPIRSARDYYIFLNNGYDAMYASAGGSPGALDLVEQGAVAHISALNYDGQFFSRWSERSAPHNVYTSYADLVDAAEHIGFDTDGREPPELPFVEPEAEEDFGDDALRVEVSYSSSANDVLYEFDEAAGGYIRSVGGERVDDLETDEPVAPRNVFVVEAVHEVIDDQGRRNINIESGGPAVLIQDGRAMEVQWENSDGVILPVDENGGTVNFLPGQTWINVVENIDDVSYESTS